MNPFKFKLLCLLLLILTVATACKETSGEGEGPTAQPTQSASTAPSVSSSPIEASPEKSDLASPATTPPVASPVGDPTTSPADLESVIDGYIQQGYMVEAKHVFVREFEGMGKLTITPATISSVDEGLPPFVLIVSGGDKIQVLKPEGEERYPMLNSFEAIAFVDIDPHSLKSGYTDIIVIADFVTGAGPQGMEPFSKAFIFKNDSWGNFVEDTELENRIAHSATTRTLTVKQVLKLAEPVDITSFVGTYTREGSSDYESGMITIKAVTDSQVSFAFDGYHVNGGEEELKLGNMSLGKLEDEQAVITESGQSAVYRDEENDYEMTFYFYQDGTFEIVEVGDSIYGHNVTAEGIYQKNR
ncbi:hypothetical protein [Gorillibacterium timonense]|uniref:hypothetical protein n=1 Tax=Gorillibacterium timonense TaxID=1689269 RepID=UPI00071D5CE1|nr:hypothetical protein [Gorillibacterium timonense]